MRVPVVPIRQDVATGRFGRQVTVKIRKQTMLCVSAFAVLILVVVILVAIWGRTREKV